MTTTLDIAQGLPEGRRCPISFSLDLLGDRWTLRLVRDMLLFGLTRYSEFLTSSSGISTNILAARLKKLQEQGLVERYADPEDGKSAIYLLTDKGMDLYPVLAELVRWGLAHDEQSMIAPAMAQDLASGGKGLRRKLIKNIEAQRAALSRAALTSAG